MKVKVKKEETMANKEGFERWFLAKDIWWQKQLETKTEEQLKNEALKILKFSIKR